MNNPTFQLFAKALTNFYVNDELSPGLHISAVDPTRNVSIANVSDIDDDNATLWYVAVHRYPYTGERRFERVVVCNASNFSFGIALLLAYREWDQIKDLNPDEELANRHTLHDEA
jgi:hypothetical protein